MKKFIGTKIIDLLSKIAVWCLAFSKIYQLLVLQECFHFSVDQLPVLAEFFVDTANKRRPLIPLHEDLLSEDKEMRDAEIVAGKMLHVIVRYSVIRLSVRRLSDDLATKIDYS